MFVSRRVTNVSMMLLLLLLLLMTMMMRDKYKGKD